MRFTEYTLREKEQIIRKGGINAKHLEEECFEWLMSLDLPEDVKRTVESTDPVIEVYGTCETVEEVIELSRREYE